jgi:hypothetical protein
LLWVHAQGPSLDGGGSLHSNFIYHFLSSRGGAEQQALVLRTPRHTGASHFVRNIRNLHRLLAVSVDAIHDAGGGLRLKRLVRLRECEPGNRQEDRDVSHAIYS